MITLIHGDDITSSRSFLTGEKAKYTEIISFDGSGVTITDITQALSGSGLFGTDTGKAVILEQLLSKKKSPTELKAITEVIEHEKNAAAIYLWEAKLLTKKSTDLLPSATHKVYKIPQTLFQFLDSVKPNNAPQALMLFHKTIEHTDAEMVFAMLIRHFRLLLSLASPSEEHIEEIRRMQDWQKAKLQAVADAFGTEKLRMFHHMLYQIDLAQKTSTLSATLSSTIDFFLLKL